MIGMDGELSTMGVPCMWRQPVTEWERMKYHYIFFNKTNGLVSCLNDGEIKQLAVQQLK